MKTAVITGVAGQDGAYLTNFLLKRGYQVYGTYRRRSSPNFWRNPRAWRFRAPAPAPAGYDITDLSAGLRLIEAASNGATLVRVNLDFYRPSEVEVLIGKAEKARSKLGWEPKTSLELLAKMLVKVDMERISQNLSKRRLA